MGCSSYSSCTEHTRSASPCHRLYGYCLRWSTLLGWQPCTSKLDYPRTPIECINTRSFFQQGSYWHNVDAQRKLFTYISVNLCLDFRYSQSVYFHTSSKKNRRGRSIIVLSSEKIYQDTSFVFKIYRYKQYVRSSVRPRSVLSSLRTCRFGTLHAQKLIFKPVNQRFQLIWNNNSYFSLYPSVSDGVTTLATGDEHRYSHSLPCPKPWGLWYLI